MAIRYYTSAISLHNHYKSRVGVAELHISRDELELAVNVLKDIEGVEVWTLLGQVYEIQSKKGNEIQLIPKIVELYKTASKKGYPPALVRLGILYETGVGVERDQIRAEKFFNEAAERGDKYAKEKLNCLKNI
jgi:TPR repeat protein